MRMHCTTPGIKINKQTPIGSIMSYYLRFEAVNLGNFVYDTNDLSTIRGGGLLLLDAPQIVGKLINQELPLPKSNILNSGEAKPITQGASWALFELNTDASTALKIKQNIVSSLNSETIDDQPNPLRHATFVVDVLEKSPSDKHYAKDRDNLHALNRWQQMQSPSLSIPKQDETAKACKYDKVRPGTERNYSKPNEKIWLSASVAERRDYGKEQKRGEFYQVRTQLPDLKFTNELEELSTDPTQGILNRKIAVIYADGNKFGQIVAQCKKSKQQSKFDENLRQGQNAVLKALLEKAKDDPVWQNNGKIRLETLLWGGDELLWVVPAWLGWQALALFFKEADEKISINRELLKDSQYPSKQGEVSFSAGLVFCRHNAPIHRITRLAHDLAEIPKDTTEYKYKNAFAYQILESFDHVGVTLDKYRANRIAKLGQPKHLIIEAETIETKQEINKMKMLEDCIVALKNSGFPKRKCYQIIQHLLADETAKADVLLSKIYEDLPGKSEIPQVIEKLKKLSGGENAHWLHLTDLWDYLPLEVNTDA